MITIITVDENGLVDLVDLDTAHIPEQIPLFTPTGDRIYIRSDWPAIGSQDFAAKLRAWHEAHNPERAGGQGCKHWPESQLRKIGEQTR